MGEVVTLHPNKSAPVQPLPRAEFGQRPRPEATGANLFHAGKADNFEPASRAAGAGWAALRSALSEVMADGRPNRRFVSQAERTALGAGRADPELLNDLAAKLDALGAQAVTLAGEARGLGCIKIAATLRDIEHFAETCAAEARADATPEGA